MAEASQLSFARFRALATALPSRIVDMVNKQQELAEVRGEDDSRGPPCQRMEKVNASS